MATGSASYDAGAIHRVAARVLPVSPAGRVLLLQGQDPGRPGQLHWVSIGGAVEPGETLAEAGVREMREETGIVVDTDALVGPLFRATHPFWWDGQRYVSDNHFFAMALRDDVEVSFDELEAGEVGNILGARWWTADELRADGTAVAPDLPDTLQLAIDAVTAGGNA
ncbi:MAG: NUDIX domain-containing protein [Nocardioidaceae bacterium]|nr:NUDIX domain-containing protein [Nocardioidaceae bacterium]MCL2614847.1 NUDIX domain-containing protein [Nocardioidaceae bacterium]